MRRPLMAPSAASHAVRAGGIDLAQERRQGGSTSQFGIGRPPGAVWQGVGMGDIDSSVLQIHHVDQLPDLSTTRAGRSRPSADKFNVFGNFARQPLVVRSTFPTAK